MGGPSHLECLLQSRLEVLAPSLVHHVLLDVPGDQHGHQGGKTAHGGDRQTEVAVVSQQSVWHRSPPYGYASVGPPANVLRIVRRQALGSWSEFGRSVAHTLGGGTNDVPSNWARYSQRSLGALPKALSEKLTGVKRPLAL